MLSTCYRNIYNRFFLCSRRPTDGLLFCQSTDDLEGMTIQHSVISSKKPVNVYYVLIVEIASKMV